jgi:hypothetical protein
LCGDETAWRAEQSKEFSQAQALHNATGDFRQQRMSEKRQTSGAAGLNVAISRRKSDFGDSALTKRAEATGGLMSVGVAEGQGRHALRYHPAGGMDAPKTRPQRPLRCATARLA